MFATSFYEDPEGEIPLLVPRIVVNFLRSWIVFSHKHYICLTLKVSLFVVAAGRLRVNFILALRFTYLVIGSKLVCTFLVQFCSCLRFSYLLLLLFSRLLVSDSAVP